MNPSDTSPFKWLAEEPKSKEDFEQWIRQDDVVGFLEKDLEDEHVLLYVSLPHFFLHAVLVPCVDTSADSTWKDLQLWSLDPSATWGISSFRDEISIHNPIDHTGSNILDSGEKLLFLREFEGMDRGRGYIEMSQRLCHVLGLHHMSERSAWCCLDEDGDIEEVIKTYNLPYTPFGRMVSMSKKHLGKYAALTGQCLFRMFYVTRMRTGDTDSWMRDFERNEIRSKLSRGSQGIQLGKCSFFRGVQIADIGKDKESIRRSVFSYHDDESKQYESFIAVDSRNKRIGECSCDPKLLANYFVPSKFPFEITPAYFKPEVLSKYKADPEKYTIEDCSISCRGTWSLQRWGVNDAGQVFTYLGYLGVLPHKEQLHWKQFNEMPKAGLPTDVIKTDFLGEWDDSVNPLRNLIMHCRSLTSSGRSWWKVRDESLFSRTHYPYTNTRAEWANELLNLDQLLIESLEERTIRAIAKEKSARVEDKMRALKLIEACLVADGFETDHASKIMSPFHEVHNLRSKLKGHASDATARELEIATRKESDGSLIKHFKSLCQACGESLELIAKCLGE